MDPQSLSTIAPGDDDRTALVNTSETGTNQNLYVSERPASEPEEVADDDHPEGVDLDQHHKGHFRSIEDEIKHNIPVFRRAVITTIPLFMGYAGMITLQHHIKQRIGIKDGSNKGSYVFGVAVGNLYLGNLFFRLLHNVLFTFITPRQRVYLAYGLMALAQSVLAFAYYVFCWKHVAWTFVAYSLAGIAIGTFESNLMSSITPLGHGTKSWAVIGIPLGFNSVSVGFFVVFAIWPDNAFLEGGAYFLIAFFNLLAIIFWRVAIPAVEFDASRDNIRKFAGDLKSWRDWFTIIWKHCFALMGDMLCVSLFSSISYYIFDMDDVPLWPKSPHTMPKNAFFAIYNVLSFSGDFFSRRIAYRMRPLNPFLFLLFSACGAALVLSKTALVAPIGMFCVMFANGSIYAHTTRFIDNEVNDRFNLISLSFWLFIGDMGSYVGSLVVAPIRAGIGPVPTANGGVAFNGTNHTGNVTLF